MERRRIATMEKRKLEKEWEDLSIDKRFLNDLSLNEEKKVEDKEEGKVKNGRGKEKEKSSDLEKNRGRNNLWKRIHPNHPWMKFFLNEAGTTITTTGQR